MQAEQKVAIVTGAGRGIGRNSLKALQSRIARHPSPANLNRLNAWNVLTYRWGESVRRTPEWVIESDALLLRRHHLLSSALGKQEEGL